MYFLGEQFVAQNRGINSGKDIPRDILEMIYDSIKGEPFKIPDESYDDLMYTFFSPEKEGWLLKQGGGYVIISWSIGISLEFLFKIIISYLFFLFLDGKIGKEDGLFWMTDVCIIFNTQQKMYQKELYP